jgi:hypothetical protein
MGIALRLGSAGLALLLQLGKGSTEVFLLNDQGFGIHRLGSGAVAADGGNGGAVAEQGQVGTTPTFGLLGPPL